jgi:hypothetical protein
MAELARYSKSYSFHSSLEMLRCLQTLSKVKCKSHTFQSKLKMVLFDTLHLISQFLFYVTRSVNQ